MWRYIWSTLSILLAKNLSRINITNVRCLEVFFSSFIVIYKHHWCLDGLLIMLRPVRYEFRKKRKIFFFEFYYCKRHYSDHLLSHLCYLISILKWLVTGTKISIVLQLLFSWKLLRIIFARHEADDINAKNSDIWIRQCNEKKTIWRSSTLAIKFLLSFFYFLFPSILNEQCFCFCFWTM